MGKNKTSLIPGFRFHPTDVELVKYYLKRKVLGKKFSSKTIDEVDIYKHAPWDLPGMSTLKTADRKWFFFCPNEKKYARGARLNRATIHGYWKTTGKDRAVRYEEEVVGSIKSLVFHRGKAPGGERTNWIMHEYSLKEKKLAERGVVQDSYVLCVIFEKDGKGTSFNEEDWSDDDDDNDENFHAGTASRSGIPTLTVTGDSSSSGSPIETRGLMYTSPVAVDTTNAADINVYAVAPQVADHAEAVSALMEAPQVQVQESNDHKIVSTLEMELFTQEEVGAMDMSDQQTGDETDDWLFDFPEVPYDILPMLDLEPISEDNLFNNV